MSTVLEDLRIEPTAGIRSLGKGTIVVEFESPLMQVGALSPTVLLNGAIPVSGQLISSQTGTFSQSAAALAESAQPLSDQALANAVMVVAQMAVAKDASRQLSFFEALANQLAARITVLSRNEGAGRESGENEEGPYVTTESPEITQTFLRMISSIPASPEDQRTPYSEEEIESY